MDVKIILERSSYTGQVLWWVWTAAGNDILGCHNFKDYKKALEYREFLESIYHVNRR